MLRSRMVVPRERLVGREAELERLAQLLGGAAEGSSSAATDTSTDR